MMDEAGKAYDKVEECETSDNVGGSETLEDMEESEDWE